MIDALGSSVITQASTKEADVCAGRGFCIQTEGLCTCYLTNLDAYDSSDGYGGPGQRGDCGFLKSVGKAVEVAVARLPSSVLPFCLLPILLPFL